MFSRRVRDSLRTGPRYRGVRRGACGLLCRTPATKRHSTRQLCNVQWAWQAVRTQRTQLVNTNNNVTLNVAVHDAIHTSSLMALCNMQFTVAGLFPSPTFRPCASALHAELRHTPVSIRKLPRQGWPVVPAIGSTLGNASIIYAHRQAHQAACISAHSLGRPSDGIRWLACPLVPGLC
jgi:hypothetical protein